ncbi:unnamed protein product [Echinostoma caproni]|uniref:Reverse transcriptase domain-containing protein n=1 Tax=Echinostoma caproni TaxID=27848 RepID=A0A183B1G5_9TREM|nr:unnamed protein product [Echinostoma caproni]
MLTGYPNQIIGLNINAALTGIERGIMHTLLLVDYFTTSYEALSTPSVVAVKVMRSNFDYRISRWGKTSSCIPIEVQFLERGGRGIMSNLQHPEDEIPAYHPQEAGQT